MKKKHTHFDVKEEAEMLKNVACDSEATALASIVLPVPGGPKRSKPKRSKPRRLKKIRYIWWLDRMKNYGQVN